MQPVGQDWRDVIRIEHLEFDVLRVVSRLGILIELLDATHRVDPDGAVRPAHPASGAQIVAMTILHATGENRLLWVVVWVVVNRSNRYDLSATI